MKAQTILAAFAGAVVLCAANAANASFLNLTLMPHPDIASGFIQVDYDAGSGTLEANGFALTITPEAQPQQNITNGLFDLVAELDSSGNVISGSLTIGGTWSGFGSPLLTGNLIAIGSIQVVAIFSSFSSRLPVVISQQVHILEIKVLSSASY